MQYAYTNMYLLGTRRPIIGRLSPDWRPIVGDEWPMFDRYKTDEFPGVISCAYF